LASQEQQSGYMSTREEQKVKKLVRLNYLHEVGQLTIQYAASTQVINDSLNNLKIYWIIEV